MSKSKSCLLMGPPGSGKTTMAGLTAVRRPVHFIDLDRKVLSLANLRSAIDTGDITVWEVGDPLVEDTLAQRAKTLARNEKPPHDPKGWLTFSQLVDDLAVKPESMAAGTWVVDSGTRAGSHLLRLIIKSAGGTSAGNMRPADWGAYLQMWQETITILIDHAKAQDKDFILTVHERLSEVPTATTKVQKKMQGDMMQREYLGALDLGVAASIAGQFGIEIGSYFEEFYGLRVEMTDKGPQWICRVHPDGKRNLRTSFTHSQSEFPCDFRKIWTP